MKKILIVPVVFVLLIAGSYGVFGYLAKQNFDHALAEVSTQIPSHIDITYKQGFLSSTVEVTTTFPIANSNVMLDIGMTTSHTIYHGPFVFHPMQGNHPFYIPVQAYTEGNLFYELIGEVDKQLARDIKEITATKITTYIPIMGDTTIQFSGEPLSKEFEIEGKILAVDWKGFTGSMNMKSSMRDFTYEIIAPGLLVTSDGPERFAVSDMTSHGTSRPSSYDIGLGDYKAGVKNIDITLSGDPEDNVQFENVTLHIIADEKEGLLTFSELFDIGMLSFHDKTYGPFNSTVHLRNLDAKAISDMNHEYIEMQKLHANDTEAMQAQLMQMATTHGVTLLSKSPEFEFENLSLQTAEGSGEIKMKISFNGEGEVVMNPFFLMGRLSAEASLDADERFLAVLAKNVMKEAMCDDVDDQVCDQRAASTSSQQLQNLLDNGQLLLENGRYVSRIAYKDGAADLNGAPLPLF